MLFKLAIQNIKRSKGYFIAYIMTVAVFFTIVYQLTNVELQINGFFVDNVKASDIKIEETFIYLKYFMYLIILFFSAYVSKFFIKRRSKEVALLKTLGLNRKSIWLIFLIENAIIVLTGFIIGVASGVLFSRIVAIISMNMIGLRISDVGFVFTSIGIVNVVVIMIAVYLIMAIIPLKTIRKSSIIELFGEQVEGEVQTKIPRFSLVFFVFFTITLLMQMFFVVSDPESSIDMNTIIMYYANAILVAFFLYKGFMTTILINFRKKHKGLKSPVKMLSYNHLGANLSGIYRMMSFITVFSAVVVTAILISFGYINMLSSPKVAEFEDSSTKLKFITNGEAATKKLAKQVSEFDKEAYTFEAYTYKQPEMGYDKEKMITVKKRNVIVYKMSDFKKQLASSKSKTIVDESKVYTSGLIPKNELCRSAESEFACQMMTYTKTNKKDLVETDQLFDLTLVPIDDFEIDPDKPGYKKLQNLFFSPEIYVFPDNHKVFNRLESYTVTNLSQNIKKENVYNFFDILIKDDITKQSDIIVLNEYTISTVTSIIVMGLFQLVFLLASMVTMVALMMSIFFRTLENLERGIDEYIIAKRVGMSRKQILAGLFIESFTTQILPFVLGGTVSIFMFNQIIIPRFYGAFTIFDMIGYGSTLVIFLVIIGMLTLLLVILLWTVSKKINNSKQIKTV